MIKMSEIKKEVIDYIKKKYTEDGVVMIVGQNTYTANQLVKEVENDTEFGKNLVGMIIQLATDMLLRGV